MTIFLLKVVKVTHNNIFKAIWLFEKRYVNRYASTEKRSLAPKIENLEMKNFETLSATSAVNALDAHRD